MRHGRGMGQIVAMHATGVVVSNYQTGWAGSMVDFGGRRHEPVPGSGLPFGISAPSAEISPSTERCRDTGRLAGRVRSGNVGSAGEAVNSQFDFVVVICTSSAFLNAVAKPRND